MPRDNTVGEYDYHVQASDHMVSLMEEDDRIEVIKTDVVDWKLDMATQKVWFDIKGVDKREEQMTLTSIIREEEVHTDNYMGRVSVWWSDIGGHKKIRVQIFEKRSRLWGLINSKRTVNSYNPGLYSEEKFRQEIQRTKEKLQEMEDELKEIQSVEV